MHANVPFYDTFTFTTHAPTNVFDNIMFISDIYLENDSSDSCLDFGESVEDSNEEDISTDDSPPPTVDSKYDRGFVHHTHYPSTTQVLMNCVNQPRS